MILIYDNELKKYEIISNYMLNYNPNIEIIKNLGKEFKFLGNLRVSERELNTIIKKQIQLIERQKKQIDKLTQQYILLSTLKSDCVI